MSSRENIRRSLLETMTKPERLPAKDLPWGIFATTKKFTPGSKDDPYMAIPKQAQRMMGAAQKAFRSGR